jgi:Uncharacterized protein conserved in bacteria (DUF2334)
MMFSRLRRAGFVFFSVLILLLLPLNSQAKEQTDLPSGDILIIYSDGIEKEDMENVMSIVEYFTYQSFQVTYASASSCLNQLDKFSSILCYKVERYPNELITELKEREEIGNSILQAREGIKNSSGENDIRLLFVGNSLLRAYLKETSRDNSYIDVMKQTGKLQYYFSDFDSKEALVKEDDFLFLTNDLDSKEGTLEVEGASGYFCAKTGSLYHIPVTDLSNQLVKAALIKEAAKWKWPYNGEPHTYAQYIVLNQVYPFQDSEKLLEIVKYLIEKEEPFVISVMPIYDHGNYPTMQRFCEILRYAQANGGAIIIHSPINQMTDFDTEVVNDYMTSALSIYMEQGVYPLGIQVPRSWMFNEATIEVMSRFRTVLISEEEDTLVWQTTSTTNLVYKDGHQWIGPVVQLDNSGVSYLKTNSFAVNFDVTKDMDEIKDKINACLASFVPLKSLFDIEHSFWTDDDIMSYKNQIILVNGKRVENTFVATEYDENFKYNRNTLQRYSKDLTKVNKNLVISVAVVSFLFIAFIFTARHRNKQTFFIKEEKKNKLDDGMSEEALEQLLEEKDKTDVTQKDNLIDKE